jgi:hypothetical protein
VTVRRLTLLNCSNLLKQNLSVMKINYYKCLSLSAFFLFAFINMQAQQVSFTSNSTLLNGSSIEDCAVDMNGDYLDDIVRIDNGMINITYQQADGSYSESSFAVPMQNTPSWSICAGDIDGNGYNDLLFGGGSRVSFIMANDNATGYTEQYKDEYIFSQRSTLADIDNDGNLDAFVCHDVDQSHPYRNDGSGGMEVDQSMIITDDSPGNYSAIWVDYDNDGDSDLYVSKCIFGSQNQTDPNRINKMYRNEGDGTYTEVGPEINMDDIAQSWTTVFEDFDNDGDFDAFIVNHDFANRLMINDGAGVFTDTVQSSNLPAGDLGSWEGASGDFNNDGFVDIFGQFGNESMYLNNGDLTFSTQSIPFTDGGIGDFNNDGFLDVVRGGTVHFNDGNDNNYVKINTQGIFSNKNGIGARVEIHGSWGIQIREIRSGQSFSPMSSLTAHFGIGQAAEIDQVIVKWPSGIITTLENPGINTTHNIPEAECLLAASEINVIGSTTFCEGESVTLEAPAGFEYLWSTGQTSQSITVSEAGNYKATLVAIDDCVSLTNTISVTVTSEIVPLIETMDETLICVGGTAILSSLNGENPVWSNGMTGQTIEVSTAGIYSVSVDATCAAGQITSETIEITVLEAMNPVADNVQIIAPGPATFTATGTNIEWYADLTSVTPLATGPTYTIPQVDVSESVFVQSNVIDGGAIQAGGKIGLDGNGGLPSTGGYNIFNTWESFTLLSVTVEAFDAGVRDIELVDLTTDVVIASLSIDIPVGEQVIDLNFEIPVGDNFGIRCLQNNLFRNNDFGTVNYPYDIGDVGLMTGSLFGEQYYYYFYDWVIEKAKVVCPSDRVEVTAEVTISTDDLDGSLSALSITPNPADNFVFINFDANQNAEMVINLFDATGKKVIDTKAFTTINGKNQTSINVSNLPQGMYYIQFSANGKSSGQKVVVQ